MNIELHPSKYEEKYFSFFSDVLKEIYNATDCAPPCTYWEYRSTTCFSISSVNALKCLINYDCDKQQIHFLGFLVKKRNQTWTMTL